MAFHGRISAKMGVEDELAPTQSGRFLGVESQKEKRTATKPISRPQKSNIRKKQIVRLTHRRSNANSSYSSLGANSHGS